MLRIPSPHLIGSEEGVGRTRVWMRPVGLACIRAGRTIMLWGSVRSGKRSLQDHNTDLPAAFSNSLRRLWAWLGNGAAASTAQPASPKRRVASSILPARECYSGFIGTLQFAILGSDDNYDRLRPEQSSDCWFEM